MSMAEEMFGIGMTQDNYAISSPNGLTDKTVEQQELSPAEVRPMDVEESFVDTEVVKGSEELQTDIRSSIVEVNIVEGTVEEIVLEEMIVESDLSSEDLNGELDVPRTPKTSFESTDAVVNSNEIEGNNPRTSSDEQQLDIPRMSSAMSNDLQSVSHNSPRKSDVKDIRCSLTRSTSRTSQFSSENKTPLVVQKKPIKCEQPNTPVSNKPTNIEKGKVKQFIAPELSHSTREHAFNSTRAIFEGKAAVSSNSRRKFAFERLRSKFENAN